MRGLVLVFGLHAGDHWFGADKVKHFFMSAFVESVTYSALRASKVQPRSGAGRRLVAHARCRDRQGNLRSSFVWALQREGSHLGCGGQRGRGRRTRAHQMNRS